MVRVGYLLILALLAAAGGAGASARGQVTAPVVAERVRELREAYRTAERHTAFAEYDDAARVVRDALAADDDDDQKRIARQRKRLAVLQTEIEALAKLPQLGDELTLSGRDLGGSTVDAKTLQGKLTLIDVWGTWSTGVESDMAAWKELVAARPAEQFQIVGLPVDDDPKVVRDFVARHGITWPLLDNSDGAVTRLVKSWGVDNLPTRLVCDAEGKVVAVNPTASEIRALLLRRLGPVPTSAAEIVNDEARLLDFVAGVGRLHDRGECQEAGALIKRLERACRKPTDRRLPSEAPANGSAIDRARAATLLVGELYKCDDCPDEHAAIAGGVLVSSDGLALTNHHVVSAIGEGLTLGAMTYDGRCLAVVDVLAASEASDVALVQLAGKDLPFVPVAKRAAAVLDRVFVVSHPHEHFYSCTSGEVARYAFDTLGTGGPTSWMEITADYAEGSSGCGIFNAQGEVVGLVCMTESLHASGGRKRRDLQMVVKHAVPLSAIEALFAPSGTEGTK